LLLVCNRCIQNERNRNPWLGWSANRTKKFLDDLRAIAPKVNPNTAIYVIDKEAPTLKDDMSQGGLLRLFYRDETLHVLFSSRDDVIPFSHVNSVMVLRYTGGHLRNATDVYLSDPLQFLKFTERFVAESSPFILSASEVVAGKGSFSIRILKLPSARVRIYFSIDDGIIESFVSPLDPEGRIEFEVPSSVRKGHYQFIAFKIEDSRDLYKADARIWIH
jgi:hypothetical protein